MKYWTRKSRVLRTLSCGLLCVLAAVGAVWAPAPASADEATGPSVPGEYIVLLKPEGSAASVAAEAGALAPPEMLSPTSAFVRLVLDPTRSPEETVAALKNLTGVEDAQPNFVTSATDYLGRIRFFTDLRPAAIRTTSAGYSLTQAGLRNSGLPSPGAANGVVVAVLDTGIDRAHSKFVGRLSAKGYDFVGFDANPSEERNRIDDNGDGVIDEAYGHGTYVAGLVALVAPRATIIPIRVLDSDGSSHSWRVMQGLAWAAANDAHVINLSLGGPVWGSVAASQLKTLEEAGHIVVAAAGNDGSEQLVSPAADDGVVGVTAINGRTGAAASFANRGSWIDVAAPGVEVVSLFPGNRYALWGGTSAAAPITSAALARLVSERPGLAVDDVISALTSTADASASSGLSAYGRIDIAAAVARVRAM